MNSVAVTGMGVVSPLGCDTDSLWNNILNGISGIESLDHLNGLPVTFGGAAMGFDPSRYLGSKDLRHTDRYTQMAVSAGMDALEKAGISNESYPEERIGVIVGTGAGGMASLEKQIDTFNTRGARRVSPMSVPMFISNMASGFLACQINAKGPGMGISSACATGGHSIAMACRLIASGDADCMLAGGVEAALTPFAVSAFASMKALSTRNDDPSGASRPFDSTRDGFVMSEGGAVLVLENMDSARKRGAKILAEIRGVGMSQDAYHIVAPDPGTVAVGYAMKSAIADAGINPSDIDYINAHGTSTQLNDKAETMAIKKVFGEHAYSLKVSSTKSMTGHLIGGAASLETVICILSLVNGVVPPTINLENVDPECDLDYVPNEPIKADISLCMNDAFGFGGQNVVLVIGKETE